MVEVCGICVNPAHSHFHSSHNEAWPGATLGFTQGQEGSLQASFFIMGAA